MDIPQRTTLRGVQAKGNTQMKRGEWKSSTNEEKQQYGGVSKIYITVQFKVKLKGMGG